jgi:hypothetical protein
MENKQTEKSKVDNSDSRGCLIFVIILVGLAIFCWGDSSSGDSSEEYEYYPRYGGSSYSEDYDYVDEPENPYSYGSGHSAGYEWAEKNDVSDCGGNSESFIEGCQEYVDQRDAYEEYEDEEDY